MFYEINICFFTFNAQISRFIPQGLLQGSQIFLLCTNKLPYASQNIQYILYADDTTLHYKGFNINNIICSIIQYTLSSVI